MADIELAGGDEVIQPIRLTAQGAVADLSGCTLSGVVRWRGVDRIDLAEGDGIEIIDLDPAADGHHLLLRLSEVQTETFPNGRKSYVLFHADTASGVRVSFAPIYFDRVA